MAASTAKRRHPPSPRPDGSSQGARARYAGRVRTLAESIERWRARGDRVALATVVATRRSAPRPVGSKLAVSERGELMGSVSGGCVESDVAVQAAEVIADGTPRLLTYGIADDQAWSVGLPCGGEIDVFVESFSGQLPDSGEPAVVLTVLEGPRAGARRVVPPSEIGPGPSRLLELDGERVFAEVLGPPPRLVVIGGIDTAEELCRAAKALGWRTAVADPRAGLMSRERLPSPDELVVAWPDEALEQLAPDAVTAVVVLTHEERLDVPALTTALASEAFYVGAIGSRRTQEKRRGRLLEAGVAEDDLDRLAGPAGLDLGGHSPAETAVSILAEVLAVRAGRTGGRLVERSGPIHAQA
ncbi:MAG: xanthine dehydrogenase accessory factor [Gaiellaceae bacterium]|nr:xanthine dehydrogenase accessory factor [Gaiellaceae bacterium]